MLKKNKAMVEEDDVEIRCPACDRRMYEGNDWRDGGAFVGDPVYLICDECYSPLFVAANETMKEVFGEEEDNAERNNTADCVIYFLQKNADMPGIKEFVKAVKKMDEEGSLFDRYDWNAL